MDSAQQCATLACMLDVSVPKPGNVHRGADFEDMTFLDFVLSAVAIGPVMNRAGEQPVGRTVLEAIQATRGVTQANTNLGIVLLLAPLARAAPAIRAGTETCLAVAKVLGQLTAEDAELVYQAIRLAKPGGLKQTDQMDVNESPPANLLDAMAYASDWDLVARQYVSDFADVIALSNGLIRRVTDHGLTDGIVLSFVELLHEIPDSLIRRKCGDDVAAESAARAGLVVQAFHQNGTTTSESYRSALSELDFWLRSDGNRRNPGTSADMITSAIFTALLGKSLLFR